MSVKPKRPQHIGNLRERVTLQWVSYEETDLGGQIQTWHEVGPVHARIEPLGGEERIEAAKLTNPYNVRIHIRSVPGIMPDWQVIHKGQTFKIIAVTNYDERGMFLSLDCEGDSFQ